MTQRLDWGKCAIEDSLHERKAPTGKMLKDLARELDLIVDNLKDCLDR